MFSHFLPSNKKKKKNLLPPKNLIENALKCNTHASCYDYLKRQSAKCNCKFCVNWNEFESKRGRMVENIHTQVYQHTFGGGWENVFIPEFGGRQTYKQGKSSEYIGFSRACVCWENVSKCTFCTIKCHCNVNSVRVGNITIKIYSILLYREN